MYGMLIPIPSLAIYAWRHDVLGVVCMSIALAVIFVFAAVRDAR